MSNATYTTVQGDTWDQIARRLYGDELAMHHLIAANPRQRNVLIFSAGTVLTAPAVDTAQTAALPPWKSR
jgi:phage tail protein X